MKRNKHLTIKGALKDRGRTKWTAMMLTEHIEQLKEWQHEDRYNEKPRLDDFDFELIQDEIQLAQIKQCETAIHVWDGKPITLIGTIDAIDFTDRCLFLKTEFGSKRIRFDQITGVHSIE